MWWAEGLSLARRKPPLHLILGMLVTALGRLAGVDKKVYNTSSFTDVNADSTYRPYDGMMVSDKWLEIDGKWYYFYTDGSLARSTKMDG